MNALCTLIAVVFGVTVVAGCGDMAKLPLDGRGALLVADDVGNIVWRVAPAAPPRASLQ